MSKLDSLQNKLDMWQRICTLPGTNNLTLTPSDVVQLRQEVAVLYARIAELEKALNIDTDLTIAGLRKGLRDATARIAELREDNASLGDSNAWIKQNYEDLERDYGVMHEKMCARIDKLKEENKVLEDTCEILRKQNKRLFSQVFSDACGKECER